MMVPFVKVVCLVETDPFDFRGELTAAVTRVLSGRDNGCDVRLAMIPWQGTKY